MTQPNETWTIIARAPVRVSFGGGGTDLSVYYEKHGGFVLSTTINRYCHVFARPARDGGIHINSADYRVWQSFRRGQIPEIAEPLTLPKAVLEWFLQQDSLNRLLPGGVELFLASEVDGGTGLGSSSAMTVALIQALAALAQAHGSDLSLSVEGLAELACHIEIERLQMPIGKQDQYASAFGSLNTIRFTADQVTVEPLPVSPRLREALQMRLMLFSTGRTHDSSDILRRQRSNTEKEPQVLERLHHLKALARQMCDALTGQELDRFGLLLHESWLAKKQLTNEISNSAIDHWYAAARKAGALGGKISGAGGGGFLLLYCPLKRQRAVREQLHSLGLREMPFCFSEGGASVVTSPASQPEASDRHYTAATSAPLPQRQQEGVEQIAAYWEQQAAINRQMPLQAIAQAAALLHDCRRRQGTVYVAGHGGSASTASHFACDLTRGALSNGAAFRVVALAENIHFTTALAMDSTGCPASAGDTLSAYDQLFAGQLATQIQAEDVLVLFTSRGHWGQSPPRALLAAADTAGGAGATIIALTGPDPGRLQQIADITICVQAPTATQVQPEQVEDAHLAIAHTLCLALQNGLQGRTQHQATVPARRMPETIGS